MIDRQCNRMLVGAARTSRCFDDFLFVHLLHRFPLSVRPNRWILHTRKKKNIQIANDEVLKHIARRRNGKFNFVFFRLNQTIWHRLLFYCCADQKLRYGIPIRWSAHRTHTHSVAHVDHQHHGNCVMCVCVKRDGSNAVGHGTRMGLGHARCLSLFIFRTSIIAWKPKSQAAQN